MFNHPNYLFYTSIKLPYCTLLFCTSKTINLKTNKQKRKSGIFKVLSLLAVLKGMFIAHIFFSSFQIFLYKIKKEKQ